MTANTVTRAPVTYAAVLTGLLGLTLVVRGAPANQDFDEITVHRIRVVEPDGTLRMVISNYDGLPSNARGGQGQNRRPGAGILFYNNEGVENGGLIFGGHRDAQGKIVDSGVSPSFDKYGAGGRRSSSPVSATVRTGLRACG